MSDTKVEPLWTKEKALKRITETHKKLKEVWLHSLRTGPKELQNSLVKEIDFWCFIENMVNY